jgi:hypothetical protein
MRTQDLFKNNRSAKKLSESLQKTFGKKLNLESFETTQLEDARNKLRTQVSQARSQSGFNENLENDALHQAQWMLDAINAEIAERAEFIVDSTVAEDESIQMEKAVSKSQQQAAGIALAAKRKGETPSGKGAAAEMAKMSTKELEKFAGTKHKNLPAKKDESVETGDNMTKLREGEIQQASAIVTAKTMVDRVGRWIEELSGMENETLLQLGDSIRDEMGQEQAKAFISSVAPAIQQALDNLKTTRDTLSTGVRALASGEAPADMLGAEAGADMGADMGDELGDLTAEPDAMNAEPMAGAEDDFAAAEPAAGPDEAGRAQRESINYGNRLLKVLAG